MPRTIAFSVLIAGFLWLAAPLPTGLAAEPGASAASRSQASGSKAARAVVGACAPDFAALCPGQTAADGTDMALCLKMRRADLSLPCRHAVVALTARQAR
jgi:hypothetical protein